MVSDVSSCRRMNLTPGWLLLLLSISAGVWSVPIDRNGGNQEVKEEVQEENTVRASLLKLLVSAPCCCCFMFLREFDLSYVLFCRTLACTTTGISER